MMTNPTKFPPALFLPTLFAVALVSVPGCAQLGHAQKNNPQSENCRSCHAPGGTAKDFSSIYDNPKAHHPVGVLYPLAADDQKFKLPDGSGAEVAFFDRNGNGQPDRDEVQLYGKNGAVTVECASCHQEHVNPPMSGAVDSHLRVTNAASALCITCHKQ